MSRDMQYMSPPTQTLINKYGKRPYVNREEELIVRAMAGLEMRVASGNWTVSLGAKSQPSSGDWQWC